VAQNLIKTAQYFNNLGFTLKIESAYRSLDKQQKLFIERYLSMKMSFPNKPNIQLLRLANTYTAGIPLLAAHTAGAAVDVLLLNKDGKLLDFGVQYPYGNIESITGYPNLSKKVKENRMLLKNGMEKYGFINYPFEYWHYSIGDVCATYLTNKKYAMYGPVDYDLKNKKIVIQKLKTYLNTYFNISLD
jgi:D-alanyl-D-alanine dipeptidase